MLGSATGETGIGCCQVDACNKLYHITSARRKERAGLGEQEFIPANLCCFPNPFAFPEMCEGMRVAWEEDFLAISLLSLFLGNSLGNDKRRVWVCLFVCFFVFFL